MERKDVQLSARIKLTKVLLIQISYLCLHAALSHLRAYLCQGTCELNLITGIRERLRRCSLEIFGEIE